MKLWHDAIPALRDALCLHFPNADAEEIEKWANELYDQNSAANSLERLERADTRSLEDIEHIEAAAKNLRLAADRLDKVGWHGGKSLMDFARTVRQMNEDLPSKPFIGAMDSGDYLIGFLTTFADRLAESAGKITPDAASVMPAYVKTATRGKGPGAQKKTEAHFTARVAYDAFSALSGKTPTVLTKTGTAYGPFLGFVSEVFNRLAVEASAETWAREVCKERKQKRVE